MPEPNALWQPDRYERYLEWALEEGTTENGVFGAKLMWGYLGDFATLLRGIEGNAGRPVPELLARSFPDLRYVQITREDKVRQAVSLWKAVQTQAWREEGGAARASGRARVLVPRDQLPRAPAHRARRVLGRLLPRPRRRVAEGHLRGARRGARPGDPARARARRRRGARPTCALDAPKLKVQADAARRSGCSRVHEHLAALEAPTAVTAA